MPWYEMLIDALSPIVAAALGGLLVMVGERARQRGAVKQRRADALVDLYADLSATFHTALRFNEDYYDGVRLTLEGQGSYDEPEDHRREREDCERRFKDAAWRIRVLERDQALCELIEGLATAFDEHYEDQADFDAAVLGYESRAAGLREHARKLLGRMQRVHGDLIATD